MLHWIKKKELRPVTYRWDRRTWYADEKPLRPYNLLITEKWISLILRSKDRSHGFSINALGFAGYFLGTKRSDIDTLIKFGPESILKQII